MYIMGIYSKVNSLLTIIINSNYMYVVISPLKGGYITIITTRKKRCDFRCVFSGYVVIHVVNLTKTGVLSPAHNPITLKLKYSTASSRVIPSCIYISMHLL
jgi:hypothetical protein